MGRSHHTVLHQILAGLAARLAAPPAVCATCRSDAMAVAGCEVIADGLWWIVFRCGECGTWHQLACGRGEVDRLEAALDAGLRAIERDLIDAGDFAP